MHYLCYLHPTLPPTHTSCVSNLFLPVCFVQTCWFLVTFNNCLSPKIAVPSHVTWVHECHAKGTMSKTDRHFILIA